MPDSATDPRGHRSVLVLGAPLDLVGGGRAGRPAAARARVLLGLPDEHGDALVLEASVGSTTRLGALRSQGRFLATFLRDQRWSKAARGAQFCEVRVNADTGELRISRWLGVFDVGRVINPKTAASQLPGSIVMGIGMALSEQTLVDPRNGRTMSVGLDSYYLPVHADTPRSTSPGSTNRTRRCPWASSGWERSA